MHVLSRDTARLNMEGIITHVEDIDYTVHPITNEVIFTLSDAMVMRMKRFRCRIQSAWYDSKNDEACITLRIELLRLNKTVRMPRVLTVSSKRRVGVYTRWKSVIENWKGLMLKPRA